MHFYNMLVITYSHFAGKSFASLVGGQLLRHLSWKIPDLLKVTALLGFMGGLLFLALYHVIGKQHEAKLVRKLDALYPQRNQVIQNTEQTQKQAIFGIEMYLNEKSTSI